ncbi:MAG: hypothetical protein ACYC3S_01135 [Chloroflexota bacterium]
MAEKNEKREHMTVQEAGRLGGHKGGEAVAKKYGHEHFEEIGEKGGETVAKKYGHEHFEEIGKKGGDKVRNLIEKGKETEGRK